MARRPPTRPRPAARPRRPPARASKLSGGPDPAAPVRIVDLTGTALTGALDALAELRIAIFRAFPYLYDGDRTYERAYLQAYADSPGAIVVGAYAGDRLVGAATAAPMTDHAPEFAAPLAARGLDLGGLCYFGESVLLPAWRGRGVGHAFFDRREARARELGFAQTCFCAVMRPEDHPARPLDYIPLDRFWRTRGYAPVEGLVAQFDWRDVGDTDESAHAMQFWMRELPG